jgi:exosome complex RNA-binding protein Csl4
MRCSLHMSVSTAIVYRRVQRTRNEEAQVAVAQYSGDTDQTSTSTRDDANLYSVSDSSQMQIELSRLTFSHVY